MASTSTMPIGLTQLPLSPVSSPLPSPSSPPPPATPPAEELRPVTRQRQMLVLISAFLTICITIGFNQSYGVFQSYYMSSSQTMLPPSTASQPALVAFIGTLGTGLTWAGSIIINPILARSSSSPSTSSSSYGTRSIAIVGVCCMSTGFALASISSQLWHLLLTQGLLYGLGSSCLYFPILSAAPEYFTTHRGTAMGLILSGAGIGGLVLSPAIRALLTAVGPRWTLRCMACVNLLIALPIAITAPPSRFLGRRPTHIPWALARQPAFLFSVMAALLQASGNILPLTFLPAYSAVVGFSPGVGAALLAVNNGVNAVSRVVTGYVGDRLGRQNALIVNMVMCVVFVAGFWGSSVGGGGDSTLWVMFVVFYGVAGGGYNALFPTTVAEIFGLHAYASVSGFLYFIRGLGAMFGSPVGGALLGQSKVENYRNVVLFDALLLAGAAVSVVGVRGWDAVAKGRWVWRA